MKGFPYNLPEVQKNEKIRTGLSRKDDVVVLGEIERLYKKIEDYLNFDPTTKLNFGLEENCPKYIEEDVNKFKFLVAELSELQYKYFRILKNKNALSKLAVDFSTTITSDIKKAEYLNNQINKCIVSAEENYENYCMLEDDENE